MAAISSTVAGTIGLIALAGGATAAAVPAINVAGKKAKSAREAAAARQTSLLQAGKERLGQAPEDAQAKARSEIERRKRIIALSGGKTILTTETALGRTAGTKTLLGE